MFGQRIYFAVYTPLPGLLCQDWQCDAAKKSRMFDTDDFMVVHESRLMCEYSEDIYVEMQLKEKQCFGFS